MRQWYLADILASKGHGVLAYGLCKDEKIENVKYVSSVKELIQEAEVFCGVHSKNGHATNGKSESSCF